MLADHERELFINLVHLEAGGITKGRAIVTEQFFRKWFSDLDAFLIEQNAIDLLEDPSRIQSNWGLLSIVQSPDMAIRTTGIQLDVFFFQNAAISA